MLIISPQMDGKITSTTRRGDPNMNQEQFEQKKKTSQTDEFSQINESSQTPITSQTHLASQTQSPSHNHKKHGFMMLACCLIPIALMVAISAFGFRFKSLGSLAILLCPLMHVGMMFSMRKSKNKASCCAHDQHVQPTQTPQ
jgi:nitrate reductase NapE component